MSIITTILASIALIFFAFGGIDTFMKAFDKYTFNQVMFMTGGVFVILAATVHYAGKLL